jgi:hypothetical protein
LHSLQLVACRFEGEVVNGKYPIMIDFHLVWPTIGQT